MERTKEYPHGRCSSCGWSGGEMTSNHAYEDHDYLCSSCLAKFNKDCPWVVAKVEEATGEVWSTWRYRSKEKAAETLARLESNPEAREGTKKEPRFVFRLTCDHTLEVGDWAYGEK